MSELKRLRAQAGVTLGLLGALTGIHYSIISRFENDQIGLIPSDVERLRGALESIVQLREQYPFIDFRNAIAVKALLESADQGDTICPGPSPE